MTFTGTAFVFGDDVNTDVITPGRFFDADIDMNGFAKNVMADIRPGFYDEIEPGDFIVAGKNFGCGSSRESAPAAIKAAGIKVVLAKSFSRIFFRTSVSIGLIVLECDTTEIEEGERLEIDPEKGTITRPNGVVIHCAHMSPAMLEVMLDGGMAENFKKYGTYKL